MDAGPVTYRPDTLLHELVDHLRGGALAALVTTGDGELVGLLRLEDLVATAEDEPAH